MIYDVLKLLAYIIEWVTREEAKECCDCQFGGKTFQKQFTVVKNDTRPPATEIERGEGTQVSQQNKKQLGDVPNNLLVGSDKRQE